MKTNKRTVHIDTAKFAGWVSKVMKENHLTQKGQFADEIGYNHTFFSNCMARGYIAAPAIKALEVRYGLKVEDILPDPPKEEKTDPVQETPVEQAVTVDLTKVEDTLKQMLKATLVAQGMAEDIRRGFRMQTLPRLDTESIAEGVKAGLEAFWKNKKDEITRLLNGIVFAGSFEAGKKLDEMRNDQQKVWKVK